MALRVALSGNTPDCHQAVTCNQCSFVPFVCQVVTRIHNSQYKRQGVNQPPNPIYALNGDRTVWMCIDFSD